MWWCVFVKEFSSWYLAQYKTNTFLLAEEMWSKAATIIIIFQLLKKFYANAIYHRDSTGTRPCIAEEKFPDFLRPLGNLFMIIQ